MSSFRLNVTHFLLWVALGGVSVSPSVTRAAHVELKSSPQPHVCTAVKQLADCSCYASV